MSNLAANDTALPAADATALATVDFVIRKFMAFWAIPLLTRGYIKGRWCTWATGA